MPLVFVHGVNVRKNASYNDNVNYRNALFQRFFLKKIAPEPQKVKIFNPYWGDYGVKFAWNKISLQQSAIEELGSEDELPFLLNQIQLEQELDSDTVLLEVAKKSIADVVDLLWAVSAKDVDQRQAEDLADLAVRGVDYVKHNPRPNWLNNVNNDQQFLRDLQEAINNWQPQNTVINAEDLQNWEVLGFDETWDRIKKGAKRIKSSVDEGARRIKSSVVSSAGSPVTNKLRGIFKGEVANFIGDVFMYLSKRGDRDRPGDIVQEILQELREAQNSINTEDRELIVIAHSMGGNIMYDIFTHFHPDINIDVLITVGSQVALFEEMKLFLDSDEEVNAQSRVDLVSKPANVTRWINIFDFNDFLGFSTEGVFQGVENFNYGTGNVLVAAHTSYFNLPRFHERLAEKIRDISL